MRVLLGDVREWVVEGVQGLFALDRELELIARARIGDTDRDRAVAWMPEQDDVQPVVLSNGELAVWSRVLLAVMALLSRCVSSDGTRQ